MHYALYLTSPKLMKQMAVHNNKGYKKRDALRRIKAASTRPTTQYKGENHVKTTSVITVVAVVSTRKSKSYCIEKIGRGSKRSV
jgi:hypothetical protein